MLLDIILIYHNQSSLSHHPSPIPHPPAIDEVIRTEALLESFLSYPIYLIFSLHILS